MINKLIEELTYYAQNNFPTEETTNLLKNTPILIDQIKPYIFFNEKHYTRNLIFQMPEFELLSLCWLPGQKSLPHGHEGEKCWTRVEQGTLHFINYKDVKSHEYVHLNIVNELTGDPGFVDGPAYIHSIENNFSEPAVGLHLYAKPFHECDVYVDHHKERVHLSYYSKFGKLVKNSKM